ncbi:hypothetical protein LTR37_001539 [Vermiconidia calcicola]|uniref:Uncharacterized protein n=1 Tax=Vermiconidia calcicola TaxID=1690605 RepID=A0ACC3NVK5_9PEZI|nr:hypothetical protein LTR37_001539 [Vermiconidia calcicola]
MQSSPPTERITFLDLAREIRDQIYFLAVVPLDPIPLQAHQRSVHFEGPVTWPLRKFDEPKSAIERMRSSSSFSNLSRACRQFHEEVGEVFFRNAKVTIFIDQGWPFEVIGSVPDKHLSRFQTIKMVKTGQFVKLQGRDYNWCSLVCHKTTIDRLQPYDAATVRFVLKPFEKDDYIDGGEAVAERLHVLGERMAQVASKVLGSRTDRAAALRWLFQYLDGSWYEDDIVTRICGRETVI